MADKVITFIDPPSQDAIPIRAKDNGDGTFSLASTAVLAGDVEIGAVELKNAIDDTRAKVAASGSVAEGDNVVGVQAPVLGVTTGAAIVTDAAGTLQQFLRGLVRILADVWSSSIHSLYSESRPLVFGALTTAAMGNSSPAVVVPANANRRGLLMSNVSDAWGYGVFGDGVGLTVSTYAFSIPPGTTLPIGMPLSTQAVMVICGAAAKNICYQEAV